jgi:hypothetical protein
VTPAIGAKTRLGRTSKLAIFTPKVNHSRLKSAIKVLWSRWCECFAPDVGFRERLSFTYTGQE